MPAAPLTHHEILGLVEPFAGRARHVDLAASDRTARKLVFRPFECPGESPDGTTLVETLEMECRRDDHFVLVRRLAHPAGLQATLRASGTTPAGLLDLFDAVPRARHFVAGPGFLIARSYEADAASDGSGRARAAPTLARGVVQVDAPLTLTLNVLAVNGVPGDLELEPARGSDLDLPEDFLAVQGWGWARLVPEPNGWTSKVRLPSREPRRTLGAEEVLERVARHLAQALVEAPERFHRRFLWARWGVVLRRSIPTLTAVSLIVGSLLLPRFTAEEHAGLFMALHYVPIAVLAIAFKLQELARFEIPRPPRRPRSESWLRGASSPERS